MLQKWYNPTMVDVCLYLQVHQPYRLGRYTFRNVGSGISYFDTEANQSILRRVTHKSYIPGAKMLQKLALELGDQFGAALSFSGVVLQQMQQSAPEALVAFSDLLQLPQIEILAETYHHTLSSVCDPRHFQADVVAHSKIIHNVFKRSPEVFRNTELIFSDDIARLVVDMGFKGALVEGVVENEVAPSLVKHNRVPLTILRRNRALSDDIAFRFSLTTSSGQRMTPEVYLQRLLAVDPKTGPVCLFLDFETFGEHHWEHTGIFEFFEEFCVRLVRDYGGRFVTPSQLLSTAEVLPSVLFPEAQSWADSEHDLSAWFGNSMQQKAMKEIYKLWGLVSDYAVEIPELMSDIQRLLTSDHFYYMCTKQAADGAVHKYFSPYETPYDAFIYYMNVVRDVRCRVDQAANVSRVVTAVG